MNRLFGCLNTGAEVRLEEMFRYDRRPWFRRDGPGSCVIVVMSFDESSVMEMWDLCFHFDGTAGKSL